MTTKNVATLVVETLRDMGVKHVFGVPSGGWVDYMEAMRLTDGIEFVLTTHEGGAAFMADVCGRLSGAPGVCFGTFGPGATNLSTGVGSALLDRSPMIALTDEMVESMRGRVTQMGIDHQALFRPLTKMTTRLQADKVAQIINDAASVALSARPGPVHIGLPFGMSAEPAGAGERRIPQAQEVTRCPDESLESIQAVILQSRKPVLAVGLGAVRAGLQSQVLRLAEKFGMPVVLTPMAKGFLSEDHPLYAGVLFHALSDIVGQTHQQADLVVAVGYDPVELNLEQWMPKAPLMNIDTVPVDLDQSEYELALDVTGDIAHSLDRLLAVEPFETDWDLHALALRREEMFEKMSSAAGSFGPCKTLEILREQLPQDGIMTSDVGAHIHLIGQKWQTPGPDLQIMTNGWSSMGFAIPAAIAAKLTRPEQTVCAVVGDGGFLMTAGELAVAVRENLNIVFVLLTDNDLALIRIKQEKKGNPIYGTPIRERGTIGGDNIFGVPVMKAATANEFDTALKQAFLTDGPVIVEALLSSREYDDLVLRKDKP
ncbi:MAG: thiamine pyrophosphate-binding protein [Pseudomonadales bacterium]